MSTLTEWQEEMLKETINIGVGRAAASLSELTNHQHEVILSIPAVSIMATEKLYEEIQKVSGDAIFGVSQKYSGPFEGTAVMIYSEEASLRLVQIMLGSEETTHLMNDIEMDALCEVGNIVLNSCLGAIGSAMGEEISTELPKISKGTPREVLRLGENRSITDVIYLRMGFSLATTDLKGHISFLLETDKIDALVRGLEKVYS